MAAEGKIDVHHHVLPQFFRDAQSAIGVTGTAYTSFPDWSTDTSLALMERFGIATAMMSFSAPGIYYGDLAETRGLARRCNEYLADLVAGDPARFGGFAVLPLPDIDASLREIEFVFDEAGLDGIVHLTHVDNRYLGHPDYEPVYEELNRRGAVVFVHPTYPPKSEQQGWIVPKPFVEYPLETTKAVSNMLFTGVLERHRDIRFILSHAGGAIPFLAHRIEIFDNLTPFIEQYPEGAAAYLKRLYFDTALSADTIQLNGLQSFVDPGKILFGTDYPYVLDPVIGGELERLNAHAGFDATSRVLMERGNAEALFPRLAG